MSSPNDSYVIPDEMKVAGDARWMPWRDWCQSVQVYRAAALTVTTATPTVVGWDGEDFDTNNLHDNATNNDRLTCVIPGIYWAYLGPRWQAGATGERTVSLKKNGAILKAFETEPVSGGGRTAYTEGLQVRLAAGDYLTMEVTQDTGGDLNLEGGLTESFFGMYRVA